MKVRNVLSSCLVWTFTLAFLVSMLAITFSPYFISGIDLNFIVDWVFYLRNYLRNW